ncbi:MAG TPA: TonB-dependent receptor [Terriglobales bacterium]|nr:TonB-dependent receptor [Terriglobales bacterium]
MRIRFIFRSVLLLMATCLAAAAQSAQPAPAPSAPASAAQAQDFEIHGTIVSGKMPLPGVTVSAANSLTGKKVTTSTDPDGRYALKVPGRGKYVVRAELTAFAAATSEVIINPATPQQKVDLQMVLLSRVPKESTDPTAAAAQQIAGTLMGRSAQTLSLSADLGASQNTSEGDAPLAGMNALANTADANNQSVSVSGQMGNTQDFGARNMDDLRERIDEMRARGELPQNGMYIGGPGGMMGGPGGGGGGPIMIMGGPGMMRGMRGGFNINRPHGMVYYSMGNSALDAAPFSLSGIPSNKPGYGSSRFGGVIGGPFNIPHIYNGGMKTMFFGGYTGTRSTTPYDVFSHVPTLDERAGNFSSTTYTSGPNQGQPVQLFDPLTGAPLGSDIGGLINPAASGLLTFIPTPNQTGNPAQNFRYSNSAQSNSDSVFFRLIHNFGETPTFGGPRMGGPGGGRGGRGRRARNNIAFGFNWQRSNSDDFVPFPSLHGTNSTLGYNGNVGYNFSRGHFNNRISASYNVQKINVSNIFADITNVADNLGITGVSTNPLDYGVPGLAFSDYSRLNDVTPQYRYDRTVQLGDNLFVSHGKHNLRLGGDYRRLMSNLRSDSNPNGTFTFSGFATAARDASGLPIAGTGYDFADFLLGYAQQTTIQYSPNTFNLSANSYDFFAMDDWRARGNLTLQLGLRYEYIGPYQETHNRIVNLAPAPGFTAVVPVFPDTTAQYGGFYPASLVNPDRNNFAPRVGIAWRPIGDKTVLRAGYGINYNLGQYRPMITNLAYQPPFSFAQTNVATSPADLSLQNGFPVPNASTLTNNYGVDKNYRLGYVQLWNLNVQREILHNVILNLGYNGSKGTRLDIVRAPNRGPDGLLIPNVQPFLWESSAGSSILHSGTLSLRKRMSNGISIGGFYAYSKSIDNASSIGGGATVVAQNDLDLAAERGLSSFDRRHNFTGDFVYELPFGPGRRWLANPGFMEAVLGAWTWSGSFTVASGNPFTARVVGAFADIARGTSGSLRADYNGAPISISNPAVGQWFNTAAFTVPPAGQFGTAGRNTIEGPGTILFNFGLSKDIPLRDMMAFEIRAEANNVFNHANFTGIDTTVNSPTYGQVISVGSMRKLQIFTRFRF